MENMHRNNPTVGQFVFTAGADFPLNGRGFFPRSNWRCFKSINALWMVLNAMEKSEFAVPDDIETENTFQDKTVLCSFGGN